MTFEKIVSEELATDLDAIKAQIKQLQATIGEKDQALIEKDKSIKELQDRLKQTIAKTPIVKSPVIKTGIGTNKSIISNEKANMTV